MDLVGKWRYKNSETTVPFVPASDPNRILPQFSDHSTLVSQRFYIKAQFPLVSINNDVLHVLVTIEHRMAFTIHLFRLRTLYQQRRDLIPVRQNLMEPRAHPNRYHILLCLKHEILHIALVFLRQIMVSSLLDTFSQIAKSNHQYLSYAKHPPRSLPDAKTTPATATTVEMQTTSLHTLHRHTSSCRCLPTIYSSRSTV